MIIKELKLPFAIYNRRERQHRFRRNSSGQVVSGLLTPSDSLLPFQFRVEGFSTAPTIAEWKLVKIPCLNTYDGSGDFAGLDFLSNEFLVSGGFISGGSALVITKDILTDENGDPMQDENLQPILTGEDSITGEEYNLSGYLANILIQELNGAHNILYSGRTFEFEMACGFYEMFIKLGNGDSFWSEVFFVTGYQTHLMPYVQLSWGNQGNLSKTIYGNEYENRLFLNTYIAHSEPIFTEEVTKDGIDTEVVVFAKITNRFIFSEIVPDYLKTALAAAPVCRKIYLSDPKAAIFMDVTRMRTTSSAEGTGAESFIEVQLEIDDELYRLACD
jgi:hypothetical protein